MFTLVNGIDSELAPANDRGMLYGQSVYETIAVVNGELRLKQDHFQRLQYGCERLSIPLNINDINSDIKVISSYLNDLSPKVLRVSVSMAGVGRGYQNPPESHSNRIVQLSDYPSFPGSYYAKGIQLGMVDIKLGHQPFLAGLKHGNRLEQIVARQQWQEAWQEALVLDHRDSVIEGTQSNVFIVKDGSVLTPKLDKCGVEGVMKFWVYRRLIEAGFSCQAVRLSVNDIEEADEVFLTNSLIGVWPVASFQSKHYSKHTVAHKLIDLLLQNEIIPHY